MARTRLKDLLLKSRRVRVEWVRRRRLLRKFKATPEASPCRSKTPTKNASSTMRWRCRGLVRMPWTSGQRSSEREASEKKAKEARAAAAAQSGALDQPTDLYI